MTVSYNYDLSKIGPTTPLKLLLRWKGSVFKVLFMETTVYFFSYLTISLCYRFAMSPESQRIFEKIVAYCHNFSTMIPVTFILGFYVSIIFTRWNGLLNSIPWPDKAAMLLATYLNFGGSDAKCRLYRRTVIRYIVLAEVLVLRNISMQVKKRFPTIKHIVESGLLTEEEEAIMNETDSTKGDTKYWMPMEWALAIVSRARGEQKISSDFLMDSIIQNLNDHRSQCGGLLMFDWVNIPLIYTQIVSIAVWTYFLSGLLANQWLVTETNIDLYVPFFTIFQFICLMGWMRVAQNMLNPLGEADDDFELNWIIDRNLQVGFSIVDDACRKFPPLKLDAFYEDDNPELPYTEASYVHRNQMIKNSCADVEVDDIGSRIVSVHDGSHLGGGLRSRATSIYSKSGHQPSLIGSIPAIRRLQRSISHHSLRSRSPRNGSISESVTTHHDHHLAPVAEVQLENYPITPKTSVLNNNNQNQNQNHPLELTLIKPDVHPEVKVVVDRHWPSSSLPDMVAEKLKTVIEARSSSEEDDEEENKRSQQQESITVEETPPIFSTNESKNEGNYFLTKDNSSVGGSGAAHPTSLSPTDQSYGHTNIICHIEDETLKG